MTQDLSFSAKIRLRSPATAKASWHFVHVPVDISNIIQETQALLPKKRWRKSVKVEVRIGFYTRHTSLFPDKDTGKYLLPLKKEVRKELRIGEGDEVFVYLKLI